MFIGQRGIIIEIAAVKVPLTVPTQAYFWPAVNKRPTHLRPGYFPTWPEEIFFDPKGKKLKNLTFFIFYFYFCLFFLVSSEFNHDRHFTVLAGNNFLFIFLYIFVVTRIGDTFQIQTQTINGWPEPQKIDPTWPGSKFYDPDPSLVHTNWRFFPPGGATHMVNPKISVLRPPNKNPDFLLPKK